jgi:hypothetical protein
MTHKQQLTERERIKCAYLHVICGVEQQNLAIAFEVNMGRVNEAIMAIELAASDPKVMRERMQGRDVDEETFIENVLPLR